MTSDIGRLNILDVFPELYFKPNVYRNAATLPVFQKAIAFARGSVYIFSEKHLAAVKYNVEHGGDKKMQNSA